MVDRIIEVSTKEEYINNLILYYLPTSYKSNYKYKTSINNKEYILEFRWNEKYQFWSICFYNDSEELLCTIKVVQAIDLLRPYQYSLDLPGTFLFCYGVSGAQENVDQFSIGNEHVLVFTNIVLREYE